MGLAARLYRKTNKLFGQRNNTPLVSDILLFQNTFNSFFLLSSIYFIWLYYKSMRDGEGVYHNLQSYPSNFKDDKAQECFGQGDVLLHRQGPRKLRQTTSQDQAHSSSDLHLQFSSVQLPSRVWLFATPWTAAHQASLSITNCQSLLKLMSIYRLDKLQGLTISKW